MDLPNLLNRIRHKEEILRRLLAVEITPTAIKSAVWQVQGSHTEIVSIGSIQAWETDDLTDLMTAIDTSLSEALAGLETEPNEVVYGLPETWVGSDGISEGKRPVLKEISHKLDLKPVGFVVTTEAIVQHLRDLEGGPPSAILINLSLDNVAISIVYLGQLQGTQVVGRSGSISSDVEEGLARFPRHENLPSRMILYDSREDLESAKQDLIGHDWQSHLPFLHFPKIESLQKDFSIRAIALSGGQEVAQSLGYTKDDSDLSSPAHPTSMSESAIPVLEEDEPEETPSESPTLVTSNDDFGFETIELGESSLSIPQSTAAISPQPEPITKPPVHPHISLPTLRPGRIFMPLKHGAEQLLRLPGKLMPRQKRPRITLPHVKGLLILPIFLIVLMLAAGWLYWNYVTADITVYVSSKPLNKTITFILDPKVGAIDVSNHILPAKKEAVRVTDSLSSPTTGTKTIGEKSKGTVTIYNRTPLPKNFSAGTTIKYQNFRFTLDKDVALASASTKYNPDFSITTEPSKTTAAVTAVEIGESYNLGINTQFSLANFSIDSYIASNPQPLSGGSSRQVSAVSEIDRKKLRDSLTAQIIQTVKSQVSAKAQGQQVVTTDKQTVIEEKYSAKVGEEAETIALNLTMEQVVYTYDLNDVTVLAQQINSAEMLPNYRIEAGGTKINILNTVVNDDDTVTLKAETSLSLSPILDESAIAKDLKGKNSTNTTEYLSRLTGYRDVQIIIKPKLPDVINRMPHLAKNISIHVSSGD